MRILLLLCCLLFFTGCSTALQDSSGKRVDLKALHGKWVLINYWAKWCRPCLYEIPVLNRFAQQHAQTVVIFGVNYDELPADQLNKLAAELNIHYPLLQQNPKNILKLPAVTVVPTTIVIDPAGKIASTLLGPQTMASLGKAIAVP